MKSENWKRNRWIEKLGQRNEVKNWTVSWKNRIKIRVFQKGIKWTEKGNDDFALDDGRRELAVEKAEGIQMPGKWEVENFVKGFG